MGCGILKILAVDSSAKACSAAIVDDGRVLGSFFINTALTHSQTLIPMIDSVLKNTTTELDSIDAFAVNSGPGSFTGVRIGVAAVKGMAMPQDKPCVSVSTLESMAYNLLGRSCVAVCVMDARRSQVYNALFRIDGEAVERLCPDRALSIDELYEDLKQYDEELVLVGDGAELCYNSYKEKSGNITIAPENVRYQNAASTAFAAENMSAVSAFELMPTYLRLPQAERELKLKMKKENKE